MGKTIDIVLANPQVSTFTDMIQLQRNVDFSQVRIIAVSDEEQQKIYGLKKGLCEVLNVYVLDLHGTGRAYNAGIKYAKADWVMFCDGRDCFSSIYSLWTLLNVMPVGNADILWTEGYREEALAQKPGHINKTTENFTQVSGKLYRTDFLRKNEMAFPDACGGMAEYAFNTIAIGCTQPHRILKIRSQVSPYACTFRTEGVLSASLLEDMVDAAIVAANGIHARGYDAGPQCVKAMYYAYLAQGTRPFVDVSNKQIFTDDYMYNWSHMSGTERNVIFQEAYSDFINAFQILYNTYGQECVPPEMNVSMADRWIERFGHASASKKHYARRVAVYSGTRNVYNHIITSMKSLLYHTRMDTVYVIAEDDSIGDGLPDCVKVINVSNQDYFNQDGPNYDTTWTYMILMRAAYPFLLPEDVVLSLDIDTIVQEDVSPLFDIDLTGQYFAGVHEVTHQENEQYCNFGVILMNLKQLRDGKAKQIIDAMNTTKWDYPEQTAFNTLCQGKIRTISNNYNATPYSRLTGKTERESIIHYAGIKYWACFPEVIRYNNMKWNEVINNGTR